MEPMHGTKDIGGRGDVQNEIVHVIRVQVRMSVPMTSGHWSRILWRLEIPRGYDDKFKVGGS